MSGLTLSASSVNSYLACPRQWYLTYIMGMEGDDSPERQMGLDVHHLAEAALQSGKPSSFAATGEMKTLAMLFEREVMPTIGTPQLIEGQFIIDVDGITYSGYIDYIDSQGRLRDLKTTGKKPRPGKYRLNMVGYYLGATTMGFDITALGLDYIVRTRHPYYLPEWQEMPDDEEVAGWAGTLHRVERGIEAGDFPPTGLDGWQCKYCQHQAICGPYQAMKEATGE